MENFIAIEDRELMPSTFEGEHPDNKAIYEILFSELTHEEKLYHLGKPFYWNLGQWLFPGGSVKFSADAKYECNSL